MPSKTAGAWMKVHMGWLTKDCRRCNDHVVPRRTKKGLGCWRRCNNGNVVGAPHTRVYEHSCILGLCWCGGFTVMMYKYGKRAKWCVFKKRFGQSVLANHGWLSHLPIQPSIYLGGRLRAYTVLYRTTRPPSITILVSTTSVLSRTSNRSTSTPP